MEGLSCPIPTLWKASQRLGRNARRVFLRSAASSRGLFPPRTPRRETRRRRDVGRLGAIGAITHLGPRGQLILGTRAGPRVRTLEAHQNRAISLAGTKEDLDALICHGRRPQLGVSRYRGRAPHLSSCFEKLHNFPHRCASSCWRRRVKAYGFLRPRTICILAKSGT